MTGIGSGNWVPVQPYCSHRRTAGRVQRRNLAASQTSTCNHLSELLKYQRQMVAILVNYHYSGLYCRYHCHYR